MAELKQVLKRFHKNAFIFPASGQGIHILIPVYERLCDLCVVIT